MIQLYHFRDDITSVIWKQRNEEVQPMKVTVEKEYADRMGLEVKDVSVILDSKRNSITVYGMIFPNESDKPFNDTSEPGMLCTFHDGKRRILYADSARAHMSFRLNRYCLFSLEVASAADFMDIQNISEIRLTPYYSASQGGTD